MLNNLLRWCSCGLVASFIMIVAAAIPVVNKLSLKIGWTTYLLPVLLIFLFISLVLLEYRYSEKRVRNSLDQVGHIMLHPSRISLYIAGKTRLTTWYLTGIIIIFLLMACTSFLNNYAALICFFIAGLFSYLFGLYLLKMLLKKKSQIWLLLDKPVHGLSLT